MISSNSLAIAVQLVGQCPEQTVPYCPENTKIISWQYKNCDFYEFTHRLIFL